MLQNSATTEASALVSSSNQTIPYSTISFQPTIEQNGVSAFLATSQSTQFEQDSNPTVLIHNPIPLQFVPVSYATAVGAPAQFVQGNFSLLH